MDNEIEMKLVVRRPIWSYLTSILVIGLCAFFLTRNFSQVRLFLWTLLTTISVIFFLRLLVKRNYFELIDNTLLIYRGAFDTKAINVLDIDKVEIESSFFRASRILLKDNSMINFDSQINTEELKKLLAQLASQ